MFKDTCSQPATDQLAHRLLRLARIKTKDAISKRRLDSRHFDDFSSELSVRLLARLKKWDSRKMDLGNYLECVVRLELKSLARLKRYRIWKSDTEISLESLIPPGEYEVQSPNNRVELDRFTEEFNSFLTRADLEPLLDELSHKEREFLTLITEQGIRTSAQDAGISRGEASKLIHRLIAHVRESAHGEINFFCRFHG